MKSKAKRDHEKNSNATPLLPVEEFALLVEGLDAADIESACAQDGADIGGVPPAWSTPLPVHKARERHEQPSILIAPAQLCFEWERAQGSRIVARGDSWAVADIHDGDEFHVDGNAELNEGDLVAVEGPRGQLLRRLLRVGGAWLLCSDRPELPAIALGDDFHCLGVVSLVNHV